MKNDVTHASQSKNRVQVIVKSDDRTKNLEDNLKKQEKANNSLSYRFAAIK